jgi:hypothetical protein
LLHAIEFWALPQLGTQYADPKTGKYTLASALKGIINCTSIAAQVSSNPSSQAMFKGACEAGIQYGANWVEGKITGLGTDGEGVVELTMRGEGMLGDADNDLTMDTAVGQQNKWIGTATVYWDDNDDGKKEAHARSFTTDFRARRSQKDCTADRDCGTGTVCRFDYKVLDACEAGPFCAVVTNKKTGAASCSANTDCESNVCVLEKNVCYSPCNEDADCASGLKCDLDGAKVLTDDNDTPANSKDDKVAVTGTCSVN